jgi:hypothetical protein
MNDYVNREILRENGMCSPCGDTPEHGPRQSGAGMTGGPRPGAVLAQDKWVMTSRWLREQFRNDLEWREQVEADVREYAESPAK